MAKKEINPNALVECFEIIEDPRVDRTKDHKLVDIIVIALCAVISGAEGWTEIEEFGLAKEEWFRSFLELEKGIPSHDTFRRVFIILEPKKFQKVFLSWVQNAAKKLTGEIISIDGKTARGSQKNGKAVLHTVSAWAHDQGIVLGQVKTEEKSNEITAIPELLKIIDIKGCTVTTDAMGCQKKISKAICKGGGDYVLALKGNQGLLHEEVELYLKDAKEREFKGVEYSFYETAEKAHGRKEERKYWITEDIGWLSTKKDWEGLKSIGMACTRTEINGKVSEEYRYYLSSLKSDGEKFARAVRGHWSVENSLHWVLDVGFREDDCRIRTGHAPENFEILRHFSLNLLKTVKSKGGIRVKRKRAGWDTKFLETLLAGI